MGKVKVKKLSNKQCAEVEKSFKESFAFISDVLRCFPNHDDPPGTREEDKDSPSGHEKIRLPARLVPGRSQGKKPARTVEELNAKLLLLKGKPKLAYKEKLEKKGLKNRLKKREKKEKRKLKRLEVKNRVKAQKEMGDVELKPASKPVYNSEGELVFSKFDFSEFGAKSEKKSVKGVIKDPKVALKKVREEQLLFKKLEEEGQKEKVSEIKEKKAWKKALLRSEGLKVKDDPELLKKTLKTIKKRKEKSKAKWKANEKRIMDEKEQRQMKRQANIEARAKEKNSKKLKLLAKRGRIIAGF